MALVMNNMPHELPLKKTRKFAEIRDRATLQLRKYEPLSSPKSLDVAESERLRQYDGELWLEKAPRWNGVDFPFAPKGEQGSIYNLPTRVAEFLVEKYNKGAQFVCENEDDQIIKVIQPSDIPEGVKPIQPSLDDPLMYSSESFRARIGGELVTVSAGYAEPPEPIRGKDLVVAPTAAQLASAPKKSSPSAAATIAASAVAEPALNKP